MTSLLPVVYALAAFAGLAFAEGEEPGKTQETSRPPAASRRGVEPRIDEARKLRTWTDATGKYTVDAEYVDFENGMVALKRKDGTLVNVPFEKISKGDQEWVQNKSRSQDVRDHGTGTGSTLDT